MIQSKPQQITYFAPTNPSIFPTNFSLTQTQLPALDLSRLLMDEEFAPNSSSISNNSTSDEAEEHQLSVLDLRKQRRMLSNRESARRSRMRKQRHLHELWSQLLRLRTDNHSLIEKLNDMSESHHRLVQENARLKEEASHLHTKLMDFQGDNSCSIFRDLDQDQSIATSKDLDQDLLH